MASIEKLIEDYMDTAVGPEDMQQLALLQLANASVQDDAVGRAAQNLQGVEKANRSALENYMMAQDEMAQAEADKALQMAQQRLSSIDMNISQILMTPAGISKEGKSQLAQLRAERESILKAFPQLGSAESVGGVSGEANEEFNIKNMLSAKDYSPAAIKRMFEDGSSEDWDEAIRTADLDLYQAMLDGKLGSLPEGMADKMRFVIGGLPQTSNALKLNDKYSRLRSVLGETQGDLKKKARDDEEAERLEIRPISLMKRQIWRTI